MTAKSAGTDESHIRPGEVQRLIGASRESHPAPDQVDRIALLEGLFDDGVPGDLDGVRSFVNKTGRALAPQRAFERPHPHFLQWHREICFKQ